MLCHKRPPLHSVITPKTAHGEISTYAGLPFHNIHIHNAALHVFFLLLSYMIHEMFLLLRNRSLSAAEKHPGKLKFSGRPRG